MLVSGSPTHASSFRASGVRAWPRVSGGRASFVLLGFTAGADPEHSVPSMRTGQAPWNPQHPATCLLGEPHAPSPRGNKQEHTEHDPKPQARRGKTTSWVTPRTWAAPRLQGLPKPSLLSQSQTPDALLNTSPGRRLAPASRAGQNQPHRGSWRTPPGACAQPQTPAGKEAPRPGGALQEVPASWP